MFQYVNDHNKYLYHYTSIDKAVDHILNNKTLMLNSLRGMNDPKEYKNWKFSYHSTPELSPSYDESVELWKLVSEEIKTKCKVLCFSTDKPGLGNNALDDIYLRGFAKPRMWAQYGDNHKGVCLIFDKQKIENLFIKQFELAGLLYGSDIKYKNQTLVGDIFKSPFTLHYPLLKELGVSEYVKCHIDKFNSQLIFEKSMDWRDENEYRYMLLMDSIENQFLNYDTALSGVVFGTDTTEEDQQQIVQMAYKGGTQFEQLKYENSTPWLSFKSFKVKHT